jgi:hypothetical protein
VDAYNPNNTPEEKAPPRLTKKYGKPAADKAWMAGSPRAAF